jgi:hypothetical protein
MEPYVTLSHYWGTILRVISTLSLLESFPKGIGITDLPPTLRDAVIVVRRLAFRCPWIDSLYIIRDSKED